ncbi:hypothetical protein HYD28_13085 [Pseudoalteromonas shioyasakiensis]|nr:hypothetical protein HYD28_13085 [Pseudoalteromonas shioyasakiensis]
MQKVIFFAFIFASVIFGYQAVFIESRNKKDQQVSLNISTESKIPLKKDSIGPRGWTPARKDEAAHLIQEKKCYTSKEYKTLKHVNDIESFYTDNLLDPSFVDQALTLLSEAELVSLINQSESPEAMYVLGMNYMWHSFHDRFMHPLLSRDLSYRATNDIKKFDKNIIVKARKWLWRASVNGAVLALSAYSDTFKIESRFGDDFDETTLKELNLKSEAYSYAALIISPGYAEVAGVEKPFELPVQLNEEIEGIITEWREERTSLGFSNTIEIPNLELFRDWQPLNENICIKH